MLEANKDWVVPGFSDVNATTFDVGCPIDPKYDGVKKQGAELEPGQEANVVAVDVELSNAFPGAGVCFAYRSAGQWYYDSAKSTGTKTSAGGGQVHLAIGKGPIDAIMLQEFNQPYYINRITYTVMDP